MQQFPMVYVEWDDIQSNNLWQSMEDVRETGVVLCQSVGFLVSLDLDQQILILCHNQNSLDAGDSTVIPLGVVRRLRRLRFYGDMEIQ